MKKVVLSERVLPTRELMHEYKLDDEKYYNEMERKLELAKNRKNLVIYDTPNLEHRQTLRKE